ncbi:MAG: VOC family protein [Devosiaceae bacterium]|nr:VOC family protein [Devosiaceae bacterium MH13]
MIVPNLLVQDLAKSVAFYRDGLGFELMMVLTDTNAMTDDPSAPDAVFATLAWNGHQLMLQTAKHVAEAGVSPASPGGPALSGSLYLRDFAFDDRLGSLPQGSLVKEPALAWYGMLEVVVQDPDGYRLVLGRREGAPPT